MRKIYLLGTLVLTVLCGSNSFAQDLSNKGKDFWVGYGYHQIMSTNNVQNMVLYFATDQVTNITITIPGTGYTQSLTSGPGNNVLTSATIPKTGAQDARLRTEGQSNKGIHITSDKPMIAYAHIYNESVSGATILFPTATLGKEYYSVNYRNISQSTNANCFFYVIATDPGTTTVDITPSANTTGGWLGGSTHTVTLNQGEIYNVMGALLSTTPPYTGVDLSGSIIQSRASASGSCKKIAVFSGSGRIAISCNGSYPSSDNYMVQAFPKSAWGKKYLTVPASGNQAYNLFRVCVSDPTTVVKINGTVTALTLQNNFFYELAQTNQPQLIEADKPIMVAQYFSSQGDCGNGNPGDPEVIYLSAVEQNIDKVLWNATPNFLITNQFFNVVIPNTGTAISSFTLRNAAGTILPTNSFTVHPQEPKYSYLRQQLPSSGVYSIQSDSGFNAIAYGFGTTESYGYNAGTNVRDFSQQIGFANDYGIESDPNGCKGTPFKFKVAFPASLTILTMNWNFNGAPMLPNNTNVSISSPVVDSTSIDGKLKWYSLPTTYNFTAPGTYTITITNTTSGADNCGTEQENTFEITINDNPAASFTVPTIECVAETVLFSETTPQTPKPTYKWWWEFKNTATGTIENDIVRDPNHLFPAPGTYEVRFANITTPGCLSDTAKKTVVIPALPTANIGVTGSSTICINTPSATNITFTGAEGRAPYTFSYTLDNGSGPGPVQTINSTGNIATIPVPTNVAGTFTYNLVSVKNQNSSLCSQAQTGSAVITVNPDATLNLTSGSTTNAQTVCQNIAIAGITYAIGGGGTGGAVTFTPALPGVTGTYNLGVLTISGTPAASGTFNYSVTTTGTCIQQNAVGTITVNPDASLSLQTSNNTQTVCQNVSISTINYAVGGGATSTSITGLPAGLNGNLSGSVFSISGATTATGTFNYTITTTGSCQPATATGSITVNADATLALTSAVSTPAQTLCINNPITDITYSIGGGGTSAGVAGLPLGVTGSFTGGVFTISGMPIQAGTFPFTVTTTGTCAQKSLPGIITVNPDATITLATAPATTTQEFCFGGAIAPISYTVGGSATNATITGLPAGVTGIYGGGTVNITGTPSVSGTFSYTVQTTGGSCLQKNATGTITINALPTADFTKTGPYCETKSVAFSSTSVPNSGLINNYTWDFGDPASGPLNNTSSSPTPSHTYATPNTYSVSLTVTTDKGCISNPVATQQITVSKLPVADFLLPETCAGDAAQFDNNSNATSPDIINNWVWNYDDIPSGPLNTSNAEDGQHTYASFGIYNISMTATTDKGCAATVTLPLTVNSSPVAGFSAVNSGPGSFCSNDLITIKDESSIAFGNVTKLDIYWDYLNQPAAFDRDDVPVIGKTYTHKYPTLQTTQTYTVRYLMYSGNTCTNVMTKTITVFAAPKVQFLDMPDVCFDKTAFQIMEATETGSVPGNPTFSGTPGVTSSGIFTPSVAGAGTHTIKYLFTSTTGSCKDSLSKTITVIDSASAQFTYSTLTCEKTAIAFNSGTSTIPAASGTITGWTWDFGDPASGVDNNSSDPTPSHTFNAWGTYNVKLIVESSKGCFSTVRNIPVVVNPIPRPNFKIPASACLPSATVAFTNISTIPDASEATFNYVWNFGDPASGALNSSTGSGPSHIYNSAGPFNVNLEITSGAGCKHDTTIILNTIHPEPVGAMLVDKNDICIGQSFTFNDNSNPADGSIISYNWDLANGATRDVPSFTYTYPIAGTYDVKLFITNSHNCRSSVAVKTVTVNAYPIVDAGPTLYILQGGSDTLQPIVTATNPTYLWTDNINFITSNTIKNPIVKGVEDITYTLTVTGRGDCVASDIVFVKVLKGPEIPNIFSPNGDGIHDKWVIKYLDTYPGGTVEIFNRYGQMIYRAVGYSTPWDGTIDGKPVPVGTYYYIVNPKNGRSIMSGYVDIIR